MRQGGAAYGGGAVCRVIRAPRGARLRRPVGILLTGLTAVSLTTASCSAADQRAVVDPRPSHAAGNAVGATGSATAPFGSGATSATHGQRPATVPAGSTTRAGSITAAVGGQHPESTPGARTSSAPIPPAAVVPQQQAAPSATPQPEPTRVRGTYLIECVDENLTQEPTSFTLACGDANEALDKLRWERWGLPRATAEGVLFLNTCEPSCADGRLERFAVSVAASKPVRHGAGQVYTLLTVRFLGKTPKGYQRVERYPLPS